MKHTAILLLIICLFSSCSLTKQQRIEKRHQKKCELAAYKWGCDWGHDTAYIKETVTNTIFRDTVIYIYLHGETKHDSVPVYVTVYKDGTFNVTTKKSILNTSLSHSEAWIENGKLRHTIIQKDSVLNIYIEKAIKITQHFMKESTKQSAVKKVEYVNYLKWWQKALQYIGSIAVLYFVFLLYKRLKRLYPGRSLFN